MTYGLTRSDTDSYTLMATVGVKGLTMSLLIGWRHLFQHQQHKSSTLSVSDAIETGHQSIGDGETWVARRGKENQAAGCEEGTKDRADASST